MTLDIDDRYPFRIPMELARAGKFWAVVDPCSRPELEKKVRELREKERRYGDGLPP
jgi:hypothetical protein